MHVQYKVCGIINVIKLMKNHKTPARYPKFATLGKYLHIKFINFSIILYYCYMDIFKQQNINIDIYIY